MRARRSSYFLEMDKRKALKEVLNRYLYSEEVHIDSNAVVSGYSIVPDGTLVNCGEVYSRKDAVQVEDLFFDLQKQKSAAGLS